MDPTQQNAANPFTLTMAKEIFAESRRLYDSACLVASSGPRSASSAPLFKKALHVLLTLVARLDPKGGEPSAFEDTVRRAREVNETRKICPYEFASRVLFIGRMSDRFFDLEDTVSPDELREFDYDVDWLPDLYRDIWRFARVALATPAEGARVRRRNRLFLASLGLFALLGAGYAIYRHVHPAGLDVSYYRDAEFRTLAYRSQADRIQFDWGLGAPRGLPSDYFSIRWSGHFTAPETATYVFALDSDDGSRMFIDDTIVIDNWGIHPRNRVYGEVALSRGQHRIRVEYFEAIVSANIELSWSSPAFPRRVMSRDDFR